MKIVIDNLDNNVDPRFMTSEQQTKSLHYVHMYAVQDRITMGHLPDERPERDASLSPAEVIKTILPSPDDNETMAKYFSTLVARVLVTHMPYFNMTFADVVDWHIPHQFSKEMAKTSVVVSNYTYNHSHLGVFDT